MNKFCFFIFVFISSLANAQMFSDFSKEQISEDLIFLYSSLNAIHPDATDIHQNELYTLINELKGSAYSESDAFFIFNGLLKQLNDGHSNVKFSKKRTNDLIEFGEFFPYELEFFDSTAVVTGVIGGMASDLDRREIFKINNVPINDILNKLTVVAMLDGECNESASDWLADDFWFYFSLYSGFRNSYSITYLEDGRQLHEIAKARNRSEFLKTSFFDDITSQPFYLEYEKDVPVLRVSNFYEKSSVWWKKNLKSIFKELDQKNADQLIIDFRDNGGGQENLQNLLLESFGICSKQKYEYEAMKHVDFNDLKGVQHKTLERLKSFGLENFKYRKETADSMLVKKSSTKQSEISPLFKGDIYVLIDGTTFSCASDAAAILKTAYPKTTLVGTESRGSGKVNYAGYFIHVFLPNTDLEVRIPRVKYVLNTELCSADSGVIPDVKVEMCRDDIQKNIDTQLEKVIDLIMTKSSETTSAEPN